MTEPVRARLASALNIPAAPCTQKAGPERHPEAAAWFDSRARQLGSRRPQVRGTEQVSSIRALVTNVAEPFRSAGRET